MGFVQTRPSIVLIDNEPCIRLLLDKRSFSRLKHVDLRAKFSVNMVENHEIIPVKGPRFRQVTSASVSPWGTDGEMLVLIECGGFMARPMEGAGKLDGLTVARAVGPAEDKW
eukprot:174424-Hanusia_phi.AAC.2